MNTLPADQHQHNIHKVFKARKAHSAQVVALKFISKHGKKQSDIAALRQEIAILTTIQHENIIMMFDAFETERDFVVATEYARGELFQILQDDHSLPEPQVRSIAIQLVNALQYLHSRRIIHRDMKPQNILISAEGRPPFYASSIYTLISLIVKDSVVYPDTMSAELISFLQGLLRKDPKKRLTWPHLSQHPFIQPQRQQHQENTVQQHSDDAYTCETDDCDGANNNNVTRDRLQRFLKAQQQQQQQQDNSINSISYTKTNIGAHSVPTHKRIGTYKSPFSKHKWLASTRCFACADTRLRTNTDVFQTY
eukprot:1728-Heterococcus_DN1.PRE.2